MGTDPDFSLEYVPLIKEEELEDADSLSQSSSNIVKTTAKHFRPLESMPTFKMELPRSELGTCKIQQGLC